MIAVIMANGLGSRQWPLSLPNYPKQLTEELSILQNAYNRAKSLTNKVHKDAVQKLERLV